MGGTRCPTRSCPGAVASSPIVRALLHLTRDEGTAAALPGSVVAPMLLDGVKAARRRRRKRKRKRRPQPEPGSAVTLGALQRDKKPQLWMGDAYPVTSCDSVAARGSPARHRHKPGVGREWDAGGRARPHADSEELRRLRGILWNDREWASKRNLGGVQLLQRSAEASV